MQPALKRLTTAGFVLALLLAGGIVLLMVHTLDNMFEASRRVEHTLQAQKELERLYLELRTAQSAARGYALLGDEASLTFHRQGVDDTWQQIAVLRRLTLDNPAQQKSLNELAEMIPRYFAHLDRIIEARRTGGVAAAQALLVGGPGQPLITRGREHIEAMLREEERLLAGRRQAMAQEIHDVWTVMGGAGAAMLALLAWSFIVIRRDNRRRLEAEIRLKALNESLERQVAERTLELRQAHDLFHDMAMLAADYVWELDENLRFREITPAPRIRGRFDGASLIGKTRWELPYLDMDEARWAGHRADLEARRPFRNLELSMLNLKGEVRWFLTHGIPLFGADGRFQGYRGVSLDITEVKRNEARLREREEQLRLFIEHAPASIAMFDRDMRYLACSRRWLDDYGLGGQDIVGRSHYEIFPEIPQRWRDIHRRCLAGATEHSDADSFIRQDGRTQWLKWYVCPWRGADGAIGGIIIFSEDITADKEAEARLQQWETIFRHAGWGVVMVDAESGQIRAANPAMSALYGYANEELTGKPLAELFAPEARAELERHVSLAHERGDHAYESLHLRKDGSRFPVAIDVATHFEAGRPVFRVANIRDISEREALHVRIEHILEGISDGFVALDRDWRYTYVNARAGQLFGRDPAKLIGKHIWTEFPEGVGQPFQLAYERAMATGQSIVLEEHYAPWDRWFENHVYPSAEGISIFFHEITGRKQAEVQLREYSHRLEALSRKLMQVQEDERRALARELHDEVGQSLTALKLNLAALRRWFSEEAKLAVLDDSIGLVEDTIGQIRDRSMDLRPPMLDDVGLAGTLQWYASRLAKRSGLPIAADIAALPERPSPEVESAAFRIAQEALTNVLRYAAAGRVEIRLAMEDGWLRLTVRDDGRGFDPAAVRPGEEGGAGLVGMRERAGLLGGELVVDSAPGRGTVIYLRLPLHPEKSQ